MPKPPFVSALQTVLRQQSQSNAKSAKHETHFAGHRAQFTSLVRAAAPAGGAGRLALFGAGNCHDLDLAALGAVYGEIHLVDLDRAAIEGAAARKPEDLRSRMFLHAPVDLSGVIGTLDSWATRRPLISELDATLKPGCAAIVDVLPTEFDVAVSCCLATQLSFGLTAVLGDGHPRLSEIRQCVLTIHLRSLAEVTRPGGAVLFISDTCSSDTYPLDGLAPDANLREVLAEVSRTGNVFFGADPLLVSQILRKDAELSVRAINLRPTDPWLWQNGPSRIFLVSGFAFERAAPSRAQHQDEAK